MDCAQVNTDLHVNMRSIGLGMAMSDRAEHTVLQEGSNSALL